MNGFEDVAYITLYFPNKIIAHINVNWLSPVKVRTTLIGGEKKMLVWNDLEADEKIKVYDKGVDIGNREGFYELLVNYRSGDMWAPSLSKSRPCAKNYRISSIASVAIVRRRTTELQVCASSRCSKRQPNHSANEVQSFTCDASLGCRPPQEFPGPPRIPLRHPEPVHLCHSCHHNSAPLNFGLIIAWAQELERYSDQSGQDVSGNHFVL